MKNKLPVSAIFISLFLFVATLSNAQQWGLYTLYSTTGNGNAYLIDTNNTVYHTWALGTNYRTGYSSYLLPGGTLLKSVQNTGNQFTGGPITGRVCKADWNGNIIWDFTYSTQQYCTHHDIYPMPNGNVLMIAYERKSAAEVAAAGCNTFFSEMWPDKIVEVQPTGPTTGTVVWEWKAWDHLVQNVNSSLANYQTSIVNHPELLNINYGAQKDWMHMNGLCYNPVLDQITFSCHNLNEIYVIDHSTTTAEAASHSGGNSGKGGDILYRWGKPAVYGASGNTVINVCHDAHWIPEGTPNAGRLVCFNNRGVSTSQSAVDQVAPPLNGYNYDIVLGQAYQPTTYTQRHPCNGYTSNMGGSQQLPNGNMLVSIALSGNLYEIDPAGNSIWTFSTGGSTAKAFRYEACYVSNPAPAIPTITETVPGTLDASAATTYQWYLNGQQIPGATNQSYTPTSDGIYLVRITDANGCVYMYSAGYHFVLPTGIESIVSQNEMTIYPNPSAGVFYFDEKYFSGQNFEITVYDSYGKLVSRMNNASVIDLSEPENGIYYVAIRSEKIGLTSRKIILIR
jgi:hypothetical protein